MKKIHDAILGIEIGMTHLTDAQSHLASIVDAIPTKEDVAKLEEAIWKLTMKLSKLQVQESALRGIYHKVNQPYEHIN